MAQASVHQGLSPASLPEWQGLCLHLGPPLHPPAPPWLDKQQAYRPSGLNGPQPYSSLARMAQ